jgi:hypothetical protein
MEGSTEPGTRMVDSDRLTDNDALKRDEALREYYFAEELVDKFDERTLKIKSWSVTSCGIALGFGFTEDNPLLFCLAAFGSLVFWYLEALWKVYQHIVGVRAEEIELWLNGGIQDYTGPKIAESFRSNFEEGIEAKKVMEMMMYRNVRVPHLFIFLVSILFFVGSIIYRRLGILGV